MAPKTPRLSHQENQHRTFHSLMKTTTMMISPTASHVPRVPTTAPLQAGAGKPESNPVTHYDSLRISESFRVHLERTYDGLRGADPTLSLEKLEGFMAGVQEQHFDPETSQPSIIKQPIEAVVAKVAEVTLDDSQKDLPLAEAEKKGYTFQEFLHVVWSHGGFEAVREAEMKDCSRPISNYFISSSHNTYLMGNQLTSKSSTKAYENVLLRGCRCIEVDVYNGDPITPKDRSSSHHRHISTSLPSNAATIISSKFRELGDNVNKVKDIISEKSHHREFSIPKIPLINAESSSAVDTTEPAEDRQSRRSRHNSSTQIKGEPVVLHGWTLTPDIGFREVCKSIRETAFKASSLPIIVSLEVHADLEQQEVMVKIMKEEWKGFLVDEAHICDPSVRLPRLDELEKRILVKVKKAIPIEKPELVTAATLPATKTQADPRSSASSLNPSATGSLLGVKPTSAFDWFESGSDDERGSKTSKEKAKPKAKICENLSALGIYTHSEHFSSFTSPAASTPPHVFSISENGITELHSKSQAEMMAHNRDFFMRAYPAGSRIDSSNPDPSIFWRKGVQMVALNLQTFDEGTMLNEGMFYGQEGWVLKPPAYQSHEAGDKNSVPPVKRQILNFKITILAGQNLPYPTDFKSHDWDGFKPRLKCELHVDAEGETSTSKAGRDSDGKYKQITKWQKTNNPDWGEGGAVLNFVGIPHVIEELSFVRLKIEDASWTIDTLAAWACIRLDRLQSGYRFIKLLDAKGLPTEGQLLVKVEKSLRGELGLQRRDETLKIR